MGPSLRSVRACVDDIVGVWSGKTGGEGHVERERDGRWLLGIDGHVRRSEGTVDLLALLMRRLVVLAVNMPMTHTKIGRHHIPSLASETTEFLHDVGREWEAQSEACACLGGGSRRGSVRSEGKMGEDECRAGWRLESDQARSSMRIRSSR